MKKTSSLPSSLFSSLSSLLPSGATLKSLGASAAGWVLGDEIFGASPFSSLSWTRIASTLVASPDSFTVRHSLGGICAAALLGPIGNFGLTAMTVGGVVANGALTLGVPYAIESIRQRAGYTPGSPQDLLLTFSLNLICSAVLPRVDVLSADYISVKKSGLGSAPTTTYITRNGTHLVQTTPEALALNFREVPKIEIEGCQEVVFNPGQSTDTTFSFTFKCQQGSTLAVTNVKIEFTESGPKIVSTGAKNPTLMAKLTQELDVSTLLDRSRRAYHDQFGSIVQQINTPQFEKDIKGICEKNNVSRAECQAAIAFARGRLCHTVVSGQRAYSTGHMKHVTRNSLQVLQTYCEKHGLPVVFEIQDYSAEINEKFGPNIRTLNRLLMPVVFALHKHTNSLRNVGDRIMGHLHGFPSSYIERYLNRIPTTPSTETLLSQFLAPRAVVPADRKAMEVFQSEFNVPNSHCATIEDLSRSMAGPTARLSAALRKVVPPDTAERLFMSFPGSLPPAMRLDCATGLGPVSDKCDGQWFGRARGENSVTLAEFVAQHTGENLCTPAQKEIASDLLRVVPTKEGLRRRATGSKRAES